MEGSIRVAIQGVTFLIRPDADPAALDEVLAEINQRCEEIAASGGRNVGTPQLLAMVALRLADELRDARKQTKELQLQVADLQAAKNALQTRFHRYRERVEHLCQQGLAALQKGGATAHAE